MRFLIGIYDNIVYYDKWLYGCVWYFALRCIQHLAGYIDMVYALYVCRCLYVCVCAPNKF